MKREIQGRVLLRVFCDLCTLERHRRPGEVGRVVAKDSSLRWLAQNPRGREGERKVGSWAGQVLRNPDFTEQELGVPERLRAYCRHHGWRSVTTDGVLRALDTRDRTVVLTSTAVT